MGNVHSWVFYMYSHLNIHVQYLHVFPWMVNLSNSMNSIESIEFEQI